MKYENLFTPMDHAIIRTAVHELPSLLGTIVDLRFWKGVEMVDIAEKLGLTICSTELLLVRALRSLRENCLRHPEFSRSKHSMLKIIESQSVA